MSINMIPQIDIGKKPQEVFNVSIMVGYPDDTPFGNLNLAEMEILTRIDYLNQCLKSLYEDWHLLIPNLKDWVPPEVIWIRYRIEDIIYSMRKILDGLICISYILGEFILSGAFPKKIYIDSIGRLLSQLGGDQSKNPAHIELFRTHKSTLSIINNISNTYKHHFVNHETFSIIGSAHPSIYYLSMDQNDARNRQTFKGESLSSLVQSADRLISDIRNDHKRLISLMKK